MATPLDVLVPERASSHVDLMQTRRDTAATEAPRIPQHELQVGTDSDLAPGGSASGRVAWRGCGCRQPARQTRSGQPFSFGFELPNHRHSLPVWFRALEDLQCACMPWGLKHYRGALGSAFVLHPVGSF